jgi:hypothetical protein
VRGRPRDDIISSQVFAIRLIPREPEIHQLGPARCRIDHDVIGFNVAMDQAGRVRGGNTIGNLGDKLCCVSRSQAPFRSEQAAQGRTGDIFHHQVR